MRDEFRSDRCVSTSSHVSFNLNVLFSFTNPSRVPSDFETEKLFKITHPNRKNLFLTLKNLRFELNEKFMLKFDRVSLKFFFWISSYISLISSIRWIIFQQVVEKNVNPKEKKKLYRWLRRRNSFQIQIMWKMRLERKEIREARDGMRLRKWERKSD